MADLYYFVYFDNFILDYNITCNNIYWQFKVKENKYLSFY